MAAKKKNRRQLASKKPTRTLSRREISPLEHIKAAFPIVGMGASAGGLKAFEQFFSKMPADCGMAFVLIPHLDPGHVSMLPELLKKYTQMQVVQVKDAMQVEPNTIYVIPPNKNMAIMHGTLLLSDVTAPRGLRLPIDTFFRSLAEDQESNAIAVVLSGTGTDGTLGLRAIKENGGLAIAQDAASAEYDGMPRSALQTGLLDYVLPPEKIAELLAKRPRALRLLDTEKAPAPSAEFSDILTKIFRLLRIKTGHDFSVYKKATIIRRIDRRMGIHDIEDPAQYLRFLEQSPEELGLLYRDLLITVTHFFRDPEAFEALRAAIEPMLAAKSTDSFRVWVPGCATGEEVYSIAIIVRECMDRLKKHLNVQIFGTDIDADAIAKARAAIYPSNIFSDITPERVTRFFAASKESGGYTIIKDIREMALFSIQDLLKDPPFTRLDLISCRNVLIYLDSPSQQRLLRLFHYALRRDGLLFLGSSETASESFGLFEEVNKKWKIFRRRQSEYAEGELPFPVELSRAEPWEAVPQVQKREIREPQISRLAERLLLDRYAPACVLVDRTGQILYTHGPTRRYLELPQGAPNLNILEMARGGLRSALTMLMSREKIGKKRTSSLEGVQVKINRTEHRLNLKATQHHDRAAGELTLITFEPAAPIKLRGKKELRLTSRDRGHVAQLERELRDTRQRLQTTIDEMQSSSEELKSYNEEVQSVNEELQSANEEMESSKEELQSLNEELATVNAELQRKLEELSGVNDDMKNLLDSTKIATLFLDSQLQIKRFTPEVTRIINLIPTDVGRSLAHFKTNLQDENLVQDAQEVLDTLLPKEREISTTEDQCYLKRVNPYRTTGNVIDGVVITFTDITHRKQSEMQVEEARKFAESIVETVREPLVILDMNLNVISANPAFYRLFRLTPRLTERHSFFDLKSGQLDIPDLRRLLENILPQNQEFDNFKVEHEFADLGRRTLLLSARRIHRGDIGTDAILLAIQEDTTEHQ
jgi:two-component system CheB/CheR fusion protein